MRMNKHNYIFTFKQVHGDTFDYSKAIYKTAHTYITITCRKHGDFTQKPYSHKQGRGCPSCRVGKIKEAQRFTLKEALATLITVHGGKYDYSKVEYINSNSFITIGCPLHGDFTQKYAAHQQGKGCPQCGKGEGLLRLNTESIISRMKGKHGSRYDYSKFEYRGGRFKGIITCPSHGDFEQTSNCHIRGRGCPSCRNEAVGNRTRMPLSKVIAKFIEAHGDTYGYAKVKYKGNNTKVIITCPTHGDFSQSPSSHWGGHGCASCALSGASSMEIALREWVASLGVEVEAGNKTILEGQEIDIYLPDLNIGIEFDGNYWHSSAVGVAPRKHLDKFLLARSKGVRLIFVREDEWLAKPRIVKSIILNALGKNPIRIFARKCTVASVSSMDWRVFCEENHLQGYIGASVKRGLFYEGELVAAAGVAKLREDYMLARFVVKLGVSVVGGLSKLMTHIDLPITTFCDKRFFSGAGYLAAGFEMVDYGDTPDLWYVKGNKVVSRNYMTKPAMKSRWTDTFDEKISQEENAKQHGWYKLQYCGNMKLRWSPKKPCT